MSGAEIVPEPTPGLAEGRRILGKEKQVLIVVGCGLITLPFLVAVIVGRQSEIVKLTAISGGISKCGSRTGARTTEAADELLGGLLTPGFDRNSCRSRYESSHYYKHFPYAPSAHLLHKLRAYEARHKKCGPGTAPYAKAAERLRRPGGEPLSSPADDKCRYIVWLPFDGLGNRMLSMLSGFLYALLTDRVLLVALPPDSVDLFCEPFPGATWLVPPDFPVADLFGLPPHPDQAYTNLLDKKAIGVNATAPSYVYLSIGYDRGIMDKLFFCGKHQRVLRNVTWLLLHSDLYFVPSLYPVAEFRNELRRMFPAAMENVSHLLARYLFHPTNPVWGLVTRFYNSYLALAEHRIGMQIRMFNFASVPVDDMYNQILACSQQEQILPETGENNLTVTNDDDNSGGGKGSTAILVASLYADYFERIRTRYYEHAARGGASVAVFQPTHEERQATESLAHNQKALAEIYLLSFSDVLLTSGMSTFGYMSSSLAGLRPTILLPAHGHKVPATPCVRAASMEPCNLTPPIVECGGNKAVEDEEDVAQHVKVCEDWKEGVKLFG